jgi:hypothetical protein
MFVKLQNDTILSDTGIPLLFRIEIERFNRGSPYKSKQFSHDILTYVPSLYVAIGFFRVGGRPAIIKDSGENNE